MADLGEDFAGVDDIDLDWSLVSGRLALAQAIACRVFEEPGGLFYAPAYGAGARKLIGTSGVSLSADFIEQQCREDERVEDVEASVEFNEATRELSISILLTDSAGPFGLVLDPADLTLELLTNPV